MLEKAIKSVIDQHYDNVEFIILDGGSKDKTLDIIKQYESHITFWRSHKDNGPSEAVNEGIEKATGDLIVLLMADDWYEPETFKAIAEAYVKHPEVDIFTCGGRIVSSDKTELVYATAKQLDLNFYNVCFAHSAFCCQFIRKKLYDQIGPLTNFITCDKEFLLKAILLGAKNHAINHLGHNYLAHDGSSTFSKKKPNIMKLYEEHMDIAKQLLQSKDLNEEQTKIINRWYLDNQIRFMLRTLFQTNLKKGLMLISDGFHERKIRWVVALFFTSWVILKKKILR